MTRIAIIGAGSGFGSRLSVDILSRKPLQDATIALCDIDEGRLRATAEYVQRVIDANKLPARVGSSTDREEILPGTDFVVTSVSVGGPAYSGPVYANEINIPAKYGVDQWVADTIGPGGVFRFLRCAPVQLDFCRDMERLCPNALMLNYTNPMSMLTWAHSAGSSIRNIGLCHSVQGTAKQLAQYAGVPFEEVTYWVAGINHLSWFLDYRHNGKDAYPLIRKALDDREANEKDRIRFEIFKHFGYFPTESSGHNSEYVPYFRRTPEMRAHFELKSREVSEDPRWRKPSWLSDSGVDPSEDSLKLVRSHEYASGIMEAVITDEPFRFNGNVMNDGLITNLPQNCCVEVPCFVDGEGVHPCYVGDLPPQCAALARSNVAVQDLAVHSVLDRDREAAFHAVALDPLTASVASLDQIREMFEELWAANGHLLTHFDK